MSAWSRPLRRGQGLQAMVARWNLKYSLIAAGCVLLALAAGLLAVSSSSTSSESDSAGIRHPVAPHKSCQPQPPRGSHHQGGQGQSDTGRASGIPEIYVHTGYEPGSIFRFPDFPTRISFNRGGYLTGLHWVQVSSVGACATGALYTYDPASGRAAIYEVKVSASDPQKCTVAVYEHGYPGPAQTVEATIFDDLQITPLQSNSSPDLAAYALSPACS
jgi:hypothetical protein